MIWPFKRRPKPAYQLEHEATLDRIEAELNQVSFIRRRPRPDARAYTFQPYPDSQDPSRALIEHAVRERLWRDNTVQEQWAKLALSMGIGVAVIHDEDGIRHFQPHPDIPDQHFYHFPSEEAFELYLDRTKENR